jgi:glutamate/tyrosine decarboxylase-like PLP-dependent enzyme
MPKSPVAICPPEEVALKSLFLGPQSENGEWFREQVNRLVDHYLGWRRGRFAEDGKAISSADQDSVQFRRRQSKLSRDLVTLMKALENETPTFTPRYVGHMVSEVSLPGILGHVVMLLHNPNNASQEVSRVGLRIEDEAIASLLEMVGFDRKKGAGHFTSGGTVANFEGLWRARYRLDHFLSLGHLLRHTRQKNLTLFQAAHLGWPEFTRWHRKFRVTDEALRPWSLVANNPWRVGQAIEKLYGQTYFGPVLLVPESKHYSWQKAVSLMGLGDEAFWPIALDKEGRLDVTHLRQLIETAQTQNRPVLAVVSVAGTTELGEMDPVHEVQDLLDTYRRRGIHIWHHVDAAYGGFYCAMLRSKKLSDRLSPNVRQALAAISRASSVTIDPHKLGYIPYACGAILVPSEENDRVSSFAAPYLHTGKGRSPSWSSTLEGSRSASGAAAMWLAANSIGLDATGYGAILARGIESRRRLSERIEATIKGAYVIGSGELNVVCFCVAKVGETSRRTNERTLALYQAIHRGPQFGVSKTSLDVKCYAKLIDRHIARWQGDRNTRELVLIRLVLMNPFISSKVTKTDFIDAFCQYANRLVKRGPGSLD